MHILRILDARQKARNANAVLKPKAPASVRSGRINKAAIQKDAVNRYINNKSHKKTYNGLMSAIQGPYMGRAKPPSTDYTFVGLPVDHLDNIHDTNGRPHSNIQTQIGAYHSPLLDEEPRIQTSSPASSSNNVPWWHNFAHQMREYRYSQFHKKRRLEVGEKMDPGWMEILRNRLGPVEGATDRLSRAIGWAKREENWGTPWGVRDVDEILGFLEREEGE